ECVEMTCVRRLGHVHAEQPVEANRARQVGGDDADRVQLRHDRTLADTVGSMRYRQLGSSDLRVSEISLGSWLTYGGGVRREQAEACVAAAFDAGINFIDTANVY